MHPFWLHVYCIQYMSSTPPPEPGRLEVTASRIKLSFIVHAMSITSLPNELLLRVLEELDSRTANDISSQRDLLSFCRVNKVSRAIG
jgi:hypothetical protein